jgi:integrase
LITSTYQTQKIGLKMSLKFTDYEVADLEATRWPKNKIPVFPVVLDKKGASPIGIDFELGAYFVLDETEDDYGLKADTIINESTPQNTSRAYKGDIFYFRQWTLHANESWPSTENTILKFIIHHLQEMPNDIEEKMLASGWKRTRGSHSLATVKRRLVSIGILHKFNKCEDPSDTQKVKSLLSAMNKTKSQQKKSKAITKNILENLVETCRENSLIDIRDRALLLFGWSSGGRRRSEIAQATIENLEETVDGDFIYHIERGKTDQVGKGHDVPVKGKAAVALREWLKDANVSKGKIFRSVSKGGKIGEKITEVDINRIVKKRCKMAGYDSKHFTAHGLRRGFITEAGKQGKPLGDTMALSGHKSVPIAMKYYEAGSIINNKSSNLFD